MPSKYLATNLAGNKVRDLIDSLQGLDEDAMHNITHVGVKEGELYMILNTPAGLRIVSGHGAILKPTPDALKKTE